MTFCACAVAFGSAGRARAHQSSIVYSELVADGRTVAWTFQLAGEDVGPTLGLGERKADRREAEAGRAKLLAYLSSHVRVENAQQACEPHPREVGFADKADGYFAVALIDFDCRRTVSDLRVTYDLFFDIDPRHQGFIKLAGEEHVVRAQARTLALSREVTLLDHVRDYLMLGMEHIFTGYDHLAFLFGLLVVAGFRKLGDGMRYVLGVVTAFTVAHSMTLIASGLDLLRLSPRLVEPAIALSIGWVAIENLLVEKPKRRWLLTFGFGLIHGFGFASVLREIGLPPRGLVLSLLSFNVGVELGQLAVVALVAPVLHLLARGNLGWRGALVILALAGVALLGARRFDLPLAQSLVVIVGVPLALIVAVPRVGYETAVRRAGSIILTALALLWFLERVLGKTWLAGALS
jgi:hypothetical protein